MKSVSKSPSRDRNERHAFIYINILKTDLGLTFAEISEQLNIDNYRTRDGRIFTEETVSRIWRKGKTKYRLEYNNHDKTKVKRSLIDIKKEIFKNPSITWCNDQEYHDLPFALVKKIYRTLLIETAQELNVKLKLNPTIDTKLPENKLITSLSRVMLTYNINHKEFTEETLNVLGGLLFHPDFSKVRKQ